MRPVWRENNVIVERSGGRPSDECLRTALALTDTEVLRQPREYGVVRSGDFWAPRYFGPPIVVLSPGVVPILARPPLFLPFLAPIALRPGGAAVAAPFSGLRLGGGGDSGKALAALAIVALLVLPAVDLGLAIAPAESPGASSQAIDQVNALNDLTRSTGSPCSYEAAAGGAP